MSTGWSITIGYNSDRAPIEDGELWKILKATAEGIRRNPDALAHEAMEYGAPLIMDGEKLIDYCVVYMRDIMDGGPLSYVEHYNADGEPAVFIMASGGSPARVLKEHVARAFCRRLIQMMHHQGIEVNLSVG